MELLNKEEKINKYTRPEISSTSGFGSSGVGKMLSTNEFQAVCKLEVRCEVC